MLSYFKTLVENKYVTEKLVTNLTTISLILDINGIVDYEQDLDALLNVDDTDLDPNHIGLEIIAIFKKYILEYFTNNGYVINKDFLAKIEISVLENILLTIQNMNNIPEDMINIISGILENKNIFSDLEILYNILSTINPSIDINTFFNLIEDISPNILIDLEININQYLEKYNIEDNVTATEVGDDNDILNIKESFTVLKELTDIFKKDLSISIANTLIYDTFIIYYYKFGIEDINTYLKKLFTQDDLEYNKEFVRNLILYTLPISYIAEITEKEYEDKMITFLKSKFKNKIDNDLYLETYDFINEILTVKTNYKEIVLKKLNNILQKKKDEK